MPFYQDGTGHINGGVGSHNDPYHEGEGKVANDIPTEDEKDGDHKKGGQGSDDRSAEDLIDAGIDDGIKPLPPECPKVFPNAVKDNNGIVKGISHNGQEGSHHRQGDFQIKQGKNP